MSYRDHPDSTSTDISATEIDAFDELLNQIAAGNRTPNSRSGISQMGPHDRIDQADAHSLGESLAFSASRFLDRVHASHESRPGANVPHPNLWETIMLSNTQPATGTLASDQVWSAPVSKPRPSSPPTNPARRFLPSEASRWSTIFNIALIALIVLAGYGFWDNRGGFGGDDDNRGIAWQAGSATPTTDELCPPPPANEGDVDEFTDWDGVITDMVNCVDLFEWPVGFAPDFDKIRANYQGNIGQVQRGAGVGSLTGFNECAWSITWLEARASGDTAKENDALSILKAIDRENLDVGSREFHNSRIESAENGDSREMEGFVSGCYPLWWTSYDAAPPVGENALQTSIAVGTPVAHSVCDLTADFPFFNHIAATTFDGTALQLEETGELILTCAADPDGTVIATNVISVLPFDWPGMVTITIDPIQVDKPRAAVLNLATGQFVEVGRRTGTTRNDFFHEADSPWLVAPSSENPLDWGITDLRTMETRLLSGFTGGTLPFDVGVFPSFNGASGTVAISVTDMEDPYILGPNDDGLPGTILVLEDSFEDSHWISSPEGAVGLTDPRLSPDGAYISFKTGYSTETPGADSTFLIIQSSDGAVVSETAITDDPDPKALWANDSSGLIYTSGATLDLLSTAPGQEPQVLFELTSTGTLGNLKSTYDPNVFLVDRVGTEDLVDEIAAGIKQHVYSVNIATGDVITFEGWDASESYQPWTQDTQFLVMYDPMLPATQTTSYQAFDAVTGEAVGTSFEAPNVLSENSLIGPDSVNSTDSGTTETLGFGAQGLYLIQTLDGVAEVASIPPPDGVAAATNPVIGVELSPDGVYLSLHTESAELGTYWLLDLRTEEAEWVQIPSTSGITTGYVRFVQGTGS